MHMDMMHLDDVSRGTHSTAMSLVEAQHMPRPRIDSILENAAQGKLVYVVAGAGYGKTQAVRNYIERQPEAVVRWVHLTESDNIGSHYWENLVHKIAFDNPDLAEKLRELGFPETLARFKQFSEILRNAEHRSQKTFLVLDDFHLIHSKQALIFAERCAYLRIPGACVIIISRTEPEINAVSLFAKKQASIVTEEELRFTEGEISEYFRQREIPIYENSLPRLMDATKGWALAIQLISLVLKRSPSNLEKALDTMRQNVFKLMETEAWSDLPANIQKTMVQLSLVSDLPPASWHDFRSETSFIRNYPALASFMWFDSFIGDYRIHPLYLAFLESKQSILTRGERQETYRRAAKWCSENDYHLDAVKFYALLHQYERVLEELLTYPFRISRDKSAFFLEMLEKLTPEEGEEDNYSLLMLKNFYVPLLLLWTDQYDKARKRSLDVIRVWAHSDSLFASNILSAAFSNLAYISTFTCVGNHRYDFLDYLKQSVAHSRRSSVPPMEIKGAFAIADIRSFACLVGESADLTEFDDFIEIVRQTSRYIAETTHNMYYGYEDLAACELAYYKNQLKTAANFAHQAIIKAREKNQRSIEAMAAFYLFHIALHEGDYRQAKEILEQGRDSSSNPNFWNRQLFYNLVEGFVYAQIGLPKAAPTWLAMADRDTATEGSVPVRELIHSVKYYLATKKYKRALTLLSNAYPRIPEHRFLLGELTLTLLTAAARIQTGDTPGALAEFEKAYALSFSGAFEMPFVELGRDLRPLIVASQKKGDGPFPDNWLKAMERKASVYAKKLTVVINTFKKDRNIDDPVSLSDREQEVLGDLYHGLSREEIAETRFLSVNTVHKVIQSVYIKLDAYSKADAIRVAMEKNLIE